MPPYPGAIVDQPDGLIKRFETIMRIKGEDDQRSLNNQGPPPKE
jgi:hypothetical protein